MRSVSAVAMPCTSFVAIQTLTAVQCEYMVSLLPGHGRRAQSSQRSSQNPQCSLIFYMTVRTDLNPRIQLPITCKAQISVLSSHFFLTCKISMYQCCSLVFFFWFFPLSHPLSPLEEAFLPQNPQRVFDPCLDTLSSHCLKHTHKGA